MCAALLDVVFDCICPLADKRGRAKNKTKREKQKVNRVTNQYAERQRYKQREGCVCAWGEIRGSRQPRSSTTIRD